MEEAIDLSAIIQRLKSGGKALPGELAIVRRRLLHAGPHEDIYQLARVLALGANPSSDDIGILEPWLSLDTDDWNLKGVINALCIDWSLAPTYIEQLIKFSGPESWKSHQAACIAALSAIGLYLQTHDDRQAVGALFDILASMPELEVGRTAQIQEHYEQLIWQALDQWMRGREATIQPSQYGRGSPLVAAAWERYCRSN